ncbi:carboxymuconolactone decarboxylase family protein [Nitrospinota bacterium]
MSPKGQELYDQMFKARGFVWPAFELLCEMDPELVERYEALKNHILGKEHEMPNHQRELIISVAIAVKNPSGHNAIKEHLKLAMRLGATPRQCLEAFESVLPPCGMTVLIAGCNALKEALDETAAEDGGAG